MAVTAVQPGEKGGREKSALENAAMILGIGAQLGQLAFSAADAFKGAPAQQSAQAPEAMNVAAVQGPENSSFANQLNVAPPMQKPAPTDKFGNQFNPKTGLWGG